MTHPSLADRTFEVIVFDWDGTAVPNRRADATSVRERVAALLRLGVHVVVVSGTHVGNIDGQLAMRPDGPGTLHLCLNRGSEVFAVDRGGPRHVWKREASAAEDAALDLAAEIAVTRFNEHGITAKVVSQRLNRRKIDIIPEPEWDDPPKARIEELLAAVTNRLRSHRLSGLADAVGIGLDAAREAGLADARVTSDAKHVEIGLTDKSDSVRWVLDYARELGIGPGLMLIGGDEFGNLGDVTGSDSMMLIPEVERAIAVSVGIEPQGAPVRVHHLGGGPSAFVALLDEQIARRANLCVPSIDDDPRWVLTIEDDPRTRRVNESILTVANGKIGIRGSRDEQGAGTEPLTIVSGVYTGTDAPRLLPGPIWPSLVLRNSNDSIDTWKLDMRTGVVLRQRGDGSPVRTFRFVSMAEPDAMAMRAEGPASRVARGEALLPPAPDIPFDHHRNGHEIATTRSPRGSSISIGNVTREVLSDGRRHIERLAVAAGTTAPPPADRATLEGRLDHVALRGFDRLLADHRAAWAHLWHAAEVSINGDPETERAVRFAVFHVLSSAMAGGEAAVGARGLSGPAYAGHVFWDSDVFVLPTLAALHPEAARAMLEYRIRRLPRAREAAAADRAPGALWPWESANDGSDVTPRHSRSPEGLVLPIRTGLREKHIVADIAWAACEYAAWSGDDRFLGSEGRDLVLEGARYWAWRARFDRAGAAHLYGMIGPDEYHEVVDDNAFTNVMARWHLRKAASLAEAAGGATPEEIMRWRLIADALVDGYDEATGVYEQFDGYAGLAPMFIADHAEPPVAADMLLGHDRVKASQLIKQPDVLMLYHLVPGEVTGEALTANLDFYGPRTAHGSSLSPAIQAAVLARAGRAEEALDLFRLACRIDLDDLTGTTAGGVHLATMGGVWQALAYGFLGIRPRRAGLAIDPRLPSAWSAIDISFRFRGSEVAVHATNTEATITTQRPVRVFVGRHARPVDLRAKATTIALEETSP